MSMNAPIPVAVIPQSQTQQPCRYSGSCIAARLIITDATYHDCFVIMVAADHVII